uniref:Uncharacterized protein n=1 Tax=Meloidogyne enterolobii TaxID=390850 RepID=A0A6V7VH29_MELEN|nr:unnamed protein product [Meloidogyne enterolobii]
MTEEEATNSDWILVGKEKNDLEKLQTNFDKLQKNLGEEKEKTVKLENELKEMDKKIQKINSDHKNEIEEMKQKFQQLIDKNDSCFKQKDGKINFVEEEIFEKEIFEKEMNFVKIGNKWKEIEYNCCYRNCINTNYPTDKCVKGYGFVNIINDENIKYINCLMWKGCDQYVRICGENSFKKPLNCLNYSLHYFEVKCIFERKKSEVDMIIGFKNCNAYDYTEFKTQPSKSWNNKDIFGCGLVYPPTNKLNEGEFPYIFLTQNGKQIEKVTLEKDNFDSYKPYVKLLCCSVETNFGNDLESNPFIYDISKHLILK